MAQVREVAGALIRASKERGMSTLLVGHVTKDGAIAGRGCWSTSSMWCCPSRATGMRASGWSGA